MTQARGTASLRGDLNEIERGARGALSASSATRGFAETWTAALPLLLLVPLGHVLIQLVRWAMGGAPQFMPTWGLVALTIGTPVAVAAFAAFTALTRPVARGRALAEADRQLELEGRLRTADEFLARSEPTPFEQAAIEDAAEHARAARAHRFGAERPALGFGGRGRALTAGAVALLGVAAWLGTRQIATAETGSTDTPSTSHVAAAAPVDAEQDREDATSQDEPERATDVPEVRERPDRTDLASAQANATPDVGDDTKDSTGRTGIGRSSGALSSSAASESRGAPSTQGKETKSAQRDNKPKPSQRTPDEVDEAPPPVQEQQDEESGSTAGKGSSKGSNKNPTASDWKSRDQVTDEDDQEIEDDEETDEDEEEQENRGGVQPSLRDRRPPVSRDLQIGFGNRPNPDANGRGGQSEQKKSRGVASLVLGVPVPDRIKGRPGPGPTKITQERIEPRGEEAERIAAQARAARDEPARGPAPLGVDPGLRSLVRRYFLGRRESAQR